jgi:hypothetical protein
VITGATSATADERGAAIGLESMKQV